MTLMHKAVLILIPIVMLFSAGCKKTSTGISYENPDLKVLFLHHSTGRNVWYGDVVQKKMGYLKETECMVPELIREYNDRTGRKINVEERYFPGGNPYPWKNYPFDYYNIWVRNAGENPYMEEPTLEMLTKEYNVIIFKHCFPVSKIDEDDSNPDINSEKKTLANYKLQYEALRDKLHQFPQTSFIVWTGAALTESQTTPEEAARADEFYRWVKDTWDVAGDNIELFDFRVIETGGGLYLKPEFAVSKDDPHPNVKVSTIAAELLAKRIIEVIEMRDK